MKLYYSPGSCSLAAHIVLHEAGIASDTVQASTKTHQLPDGSDYYAINALGYVPLLELDDGAHLRENPAILQYLADLAPTKNLAPAQGTMQRYRLQEWLGFIGTELHQKYSPLFNPGMPEEAKALFKDKLKSRYQWLDGQLEGKTWLTGEHFSVADAYLFVVTNWSKFVGLDLSDFARLQAWQARVAERPTVQAALKAEGLAG